MSTNGDPASGLKQGPPPLPPDLGKELAPVEARERNPALDVLRGMALLGILIINMVYFSHPTDYYGLRHGLMQSWVDQLAEYLSVLLVEGKCYTLFSFLFGMGFAMQMERAKARGRRLTGTYTRRLLLLIGLGLLHGLFLWQGDVLFLYGLCGFGLFLFCNCKAKTLQIWAFVLIFVQAVMCSFFGGVLWLLQILEGSSSSLEEVMGLDPSLHRELQEAFVTGGYWDVLAYRASSWFETTLTLLILSSTFFAMFLLGMHPVARAAMADPTSYRPLLKKCALWCGGLGLAINTPSAALFMAGLSSGNIGMAVIHIGLLAFGGPLLALCYVSLFLLGSRWLLQNCVIRAIGKAGRMALSNYLLQSLIATTLFYGYGLGWGGSMGRFETIVLALGIFGLQVLISQAWLNYFRFGPVEWLWRSLTYGKRQPMRTPRLPFTKSF